MSNQTILWGMLLLPWLTLFLMPKEDIKRWMPAALFVIATNTIIIDAGVTLKLWEIRENIYPFSEMISYVYGALPVGAMWILKYTYGRFLLYAAAQIMGSLVLIFLVQPVLHRREIFVWLNQDMFSGMGAFIITAIHLIIVYSYQMWQEDVFVRSK
ncbi:hypothetical protein [Sporomusa termitida]|uniref:Uncharacterized protein n=1 Tax=Sporomusa termitida TaxID=2377 RepID=A0A517DSH4_9FIRM|nr:hypothetical protein [Sporomusa termitida]QDR80314.1 hypothetical protein SPTER_16370 [Sporomusa termitida]